MFIGLKQTQEEVNIIFQADHQWGLANIYQFCSHYGGSLTQIFPDNTDGVRVYLEELEAQILNCLIGRSLAKSADHSFNSLYISYIELAKHTRWSYPSVRKYASSLCKKLATIGCECISEGFVERRGRKMRRDQLALTFTGKILQDADLVQPLQYKFNFQK